MHKCLGPPIWDWRAEGFKLCSAVSYFSTRKGSIIGAGRLSFRVRDGSGRFPAAVAAVTLFSFQPPWFTHIVVCVFLVVGCGLLDLWFVVARFCGVLRVNPVYLVSFP